LAGSLHQKKKAMNKILYLSVLTVIPIVAVTAVSKTFDIRQDKELVWKKIDSLEGQGLYRSALSLVDGVYRDARRDMDQENEIRSLIYRLKYTQELEEEGQEAAIELLVREPADDRLVPTALKFSMLGELYQRYYMVNRWDISQRPETKIEEEGIKKRELKEQLKLWGPGNFYRVILDCYRKSLAYPGKLSQIPVSSVKGLWTGSLKDTANSPAVYDILMRRALEFLNSSESFTVASLRPSILCSEELFMESDRFLKAIPEEELNSSNPWYQALRWYGDWLYYSNSRLTADLMRLKYVYDQSCHPHRDSLYASALEKMAAGREKTADAAILYEALAEYHLGMGQRYAINHEDTLKFKGERKKAEGWLEKAILWDETAAGRNCRNLLSDLLEPDFHAQVEAVQLPGRVFPSSIEYRNIHRIYYRIFRFNALEYFSRWNEMDQSEKLTRLDLLTPQEEGSETIPDDGDRNPHRVNILLGPLAPGFYLISFSNEPDWHSRSAKVVTIPVSISRITLITSHKNQGVRTFYLRDRQSGASLQGLLAIPWFITYSPEKRRYEFERGQTYLSEKEGFLAIPDGATDRVDRSPKSYRLQLITGGDTLLTPEPFFPVYMRDEKVMQTSALIYTDRKLYKPGDALHFRGILMDRKGDSLMVHRQDSVELTLQDPRYQTVEKMWLPVDDLGVFSGSFILPPKGLTGSYQLITRNGSVNISMEQYRRPSFDIVLDGGHQAYRNGDVIEVTGKVTALSGEPVPGAEVLSETNLLPQYRPWRRYPVMGRMARIHSSRVVTDSNGNFTWKWKSIPESANPYGSGMPLNYQITFRVTDRNGETREEQVTVFAGKGSARLESQFPDVLKIGDTLKARVRTASPDGRWLNLPVTVTLSRLKDPGRTWIDPVLPEPDRFIMTMKQWSKRVPQLPYRNEHLVKNFPVESRLLEMKVQSDSASTVTIITAKAWKEGWYRVGMSSEDPALTDTVDQYIYLRQPAGSSLAAGTAFRAELSSDHPRMGETLVITIGAKNKSYVFTELLLPHGSTEQFWSRTGRTIMEKSWKVDPSWQGGGVIHLVMLQDNRVYEKRFNLIIPWQNKNLTLKGFDDVGRVKPGDSVRLLLRLADENGNPVRASIGITVYDASLDKILPFGWAVPKWPDFTERPVCNVMAPVPVASSLLLSPESQRVDVPYTEPLQLNWWGMGFYGIDRMDRPMMKAATGRVNPVAEDAALQSVNEEEAGGAAGISKDDGAAMKSEGAAIEIRQDFRETALFNGSLVTSPDGTAEVAFKVPEVFTEWKMLVTGHTSAMSTVLAEHRFRSAKDLMLKPHFPLFARIGDTLNLAARLGWYGDRTVEPVSLLTARNLVSRDLKTWKPIASRLTKSNTALMTWELTVDKPGDLRYELVSSDGKVQDGLADTIDIYPDQVELWRSLPFYLNKPGSKEIKVTGEAREAILEVVTTPAWQVLQSLPVIIGKERDCSEYWYSRLYLAGVTGLIADRMPEVSRFYLDNPPEVILDSLSHPMLRNQAIKGTDWASSPWNRVEGNEKARVLQIREWMDRDKRDKEMAFVLERLISMRNPDGSWPWFRGMGSDWFTTQMILAGLGEMKAWKILDIMSSQRGRTIINETISALDGRMSKQFREIMKTDSLGRQKTHLDPLLIHYLYTRSFYAGTTFAPEDEIAWIHFTERIPKEWMYHEPGLQAILAIACIQSGKTAFAVPIYKSLRERMKQSDEMGSYWPRKGFASSWHQWDLWMQSRMIELFAALEEGRKDLDQLRLYLVHQKRGRDWGNGMVAAWVARSLLFYGSDWTVQPAKVAIRWGKEQISPLRIKTGSTGPTGYYRMNWDQQESVPADESLRLFHQGGGPAWGTLYTREDHSLDQLSATDGPLQVRRVLLCQDDQGNWGQLRKDQQVRVGQMLKIRIILTSDRELSYLELKDYLASGFAPVRVLSGFHYKAGLQWYQAREPESVIFYMPYIPKGQQTIEYEVVAEQAGRFFGGYSTIQCLYAPEFRAWSGSARIHAGS